MSFRSIYKKLNPTGQTVRTFKISSGDLLEVINVEGLMALLEEENVLSPEDLSNARIDWHFIKFPIGEPILCLSCEQLEESLSLKVLYKEQVYDCIASVSNFKIISHSPDEEDNDQKGDGQ